MIINRLKNLSLIMFTFLFSIIIVLIGIFKNNKMYKIHSEIKQIDQEIYGEVGNVKILNTCRFFNINGTAADEVIRGKFLAATSNPYWGEPFRSCNNDTYMVRVSLVKGKTNPDLGEVIDSNSVDYEPVKDSAGNTHHVDFLPKYANATDPYEVALRNKFQYYSTGFLHDSNLHALKEDDYNFRNFLNIYKQFYVYFYGDIKTDNMDNLIASTPNFLSGNQVNKKVYENENDNYLTKNIDGNQYVSVRLDKGITNAMYRNAVDDNNLKEVIGADNSFKVSFKDSNHNFYLKTATGDSFSGDSYLEKFSKYMEYVLNSVDPYNKYIYTDTPLFRVSTTTKDDLKEFLVSKNAIGELLNLYGISYGEALEKDYYMIIEPIYSTTYFYNHNCRVAGDGNAIVNKLAAHQTLNCESYILSTNFTSGIAIKYFLNDTELLNRKSLYNGLYVNDNYACELKSQAQTDTMNYLYKDLNTNARVDTGLKINYTSIISNACELSNFSTNSEFNEAVQSLKSHGTNFSDITTIGGHCYAINPSSAANGTTRYTSIGSAAAYYCVLTDLKNKDREKYDYIISNYVYSPSNTAHNIYNNFINSYGKGVNLMSMADFSKPKFRIIDINNPFPGNSGTGRNIGYNWKDNCRREKYITEANNSYNKNSTEAMYSITLNPSDISKIKTYAYVYGSNNDDFMDYLKGLSGSNLDNTLEVNDDIINAKPTCP